MYIFVFLTVVGPISTSGLFHRRSDYWTINISYNVIYIDDFCFTVDAPVLYFPADGASVVAPPPVPRSPSSVALHLPRRARLVLNASACLIRQVLMGDVGRRSLAGTVVPAPSVNSPSTVPRRARCLYFGCPTPGKDCSLFRFKMQMVYTLL